LEERLFDLFRFDMLRDAFHQYGQWVLDKMIGSVEDKDRENKGTDGIHNG
jgi:hypothetical protein